MIIPDIDLKEYFYELPKDRIANYPSEERGQSKLLVLKEDKVSETSFTNIVSLLPKNTFLIFNNTRVLPARILLKTNSGVSIELFCLKAIAQNISEGLSKSELWECFIGNLRRWNPEDVLQVDDLSVTFKEALEDSWVVEFRWEGDSTFYDQLEKHGKVPLPPYFKREAQPLDNLRYQTVYGMEKGSVAAPTAGLHFTSNIIRDIKNKGILTDEVTLHIGAGTFKPIKVPNINSHVMHAESFLIRKVTLEFLLDNAQRTAIPVGTTSMRMLESLYWIGIKIINGESNPFLVGQWDGYIETTISREESLSSLLNYFNANGIEQQWASTQIFILPGYKFRICKGLITNFHQPHSTLILLVAAFVGEKWKKVYNYALDNEFRFLSYGDSSLLIP